MNEISNYLIDNPFKDTIETFLKLRSLGLLCHPTGGPDGKKPVGVRSWKDAQISSERFLKTHEKQNGCNVGLRTGSSNDTMVVDCDDPTQENQDWILEHFGEPKVVVNTPSGGYHAYYKYMDETNTTALKEGIDIRGENGYVVFPTSYSHEHKTYYHFIKGSFDDLLNLEPAKPDNPARKKNALLVQAKETKSTNNPPRSLKTFQEGDIFIPIGERNITLFKVVKDHLFVDGQTEDDTLKKALNYNDDKMQKPLSVDEVSKVVSQVHKMYSENRLYRSGEGHAWIPHHLFVELLNDSDALQTIMYLMFHNMWREELYVVYSGLGKTFDRDRRMVSNTIKKLEKDGFIKWVRKESHGYKSINVYSWGPKLETYHRRHHQRVYNDSGTIDYIDRVDHIPTTTNSHHEGISEALH